MAVANFLKRLTTRVRGDIYDDLGVMCVQRGYGATRAELAREILTQAVDSWRRENEIVPTDFSSK